jgi:hypothetical protein
MWCWRRMEKISWTDRVRNEEVLHTVKEERNILHTIKRRKANWIGCILCRNCLLKHVTEGKLDRRIQMTRRQGRRCKQVLDDLKEKSRYWKLIKEALECTMWENSVWKRLQTCHKTDYRMNEKCKILKQCLLWWKVYITSTVFLISALLKLRTAHFWPLLM